MDAPSVFGLLISCTGNECVNQSVTTAATSNLVKTVCPYCGVGCGMLLQVENNRVAKVIGNKEHPANFGRLCTKGTTCAGALESSSRLAYGSVRESRDGKFIQKPIDSVLATTAERLRAIIDKHGPDSVALYVSGQMSLESQYLANKLCKGFIGTNNIDSNSRLCMASAASGYKLSLGADGPPGSYKDLDLSHCFLVIGSNMAECHPILYLRMMDRVKTGAKLIVVDPRKTPTADKADLYLPIKPGTDLAFLNGILHLLIENNKIDRAFIQKHTKGWEQLEALLKEYTPANVAEWTGLPEADIRKAAEWIGSAPEFVTLWTMGLNQSTHGTWHTNAICNLHLATGKICRPGSGPFSLTGQPNAMGGREVGYLSAGLPGQRVVMKDADRGFIENLWGVKSGTIPAKPGYDAVTLFKKMESGEVKALWVICTNPIASMPNRQRVINALQKAELVVVQDAFHATETSRYADVLLPGALWAEADGTMVNSERNVTLMRKAIDPPGEALADWEIIARVARKMGFENGFNFDSASAVFDEIRATHNPKTGYDLRGMSYEKLRQRPMQWPCGPDGTDTNPIRYIDPESAQKNPNDTSSMQFATDDGLGHFHARPYLPPDELPDEEFPFVLLTGRTAHQWHTMTKTGKIPTLNKLNPAPFVEIHPEDAAALNIQSGDCVAVSSRRGSAMYPATVTNRIRPGSCFAPIHWNDLFGDKWAVNAATSEATDPISLQPELKYCAVKLERVAAQKPPETGFSFEAPLPSTPPKPDTPGGGQMDNASPMSRLLGKAMNALSLNPRRFAGQQKLYLEGLFCAIATELEEEDGALKSVPVLPQAAPFDAEDRSWIDGYLAGLFSRSNAAHANGTSTLTSTATRNTTVTILFGSQTGNAEAFAHKVAKTFLARGIEAPVYPLCEHSKVHWNHAQTVLIITSTYGDGDAPDNAREFWGFLSSTSAPNMPGISFAVLALGDTNYDQFCKFGRDVDARLQVLGARRLIPRVDCDSDFEATASAWLEQIQSALSAETQPSLPVPAGDSVSITVSDERSSSVAVTQSPAYTKAKPFLAQVINNRVLTGPKSEKEVRHVAISLLDSGLTYEAGDALGIWPTNCPELADELLALLHFSGTENVTGAQGHAVPLRETLVSQYDISKPSTELLAALAAKSSGPLKNLIGPEQSAELKKYLWGRQIADLLHEHREATFRPEEFLALLKKLQPRLYSISSSPSANPGEVHITSGVVRYETSSRTRKGVCSTFLAERSGNVKVPVFIQPSHGFKLPKDGNTPIIMVGPGTGIAPFRAFLQERRAAQAKGRNWLFFGDQRRAENFLYQDELESLHGCGFLNRFDTAFSRDQAEKIYVQNRMLENGAELYRWLQDGAHFYVCGDASRMAKDVDAALHSVVREHGGLSAEGASAYVEALRCAKRYQRDVY